MEIRTACGTVVLVDDDIDLSETSGRVYMCTSGYAQVWHRKSNKLLLLHRFILGAKKMEMVDHISGDKMDCRKSNLRICSASDNARNRMVYGYHVDKKPSGLIRYRARAYGNDGKRVHLGVYATPEEATAAYAAYCVEHRGDFGPRIRPKNMHARLSEVRKR